MKVATRRYKLHFNDLLCIYIYASHTHQHREREREGEREPIEIYMLQLIEILPSVRQLLMNPNHIYPIF